MTDVLRDLPRLSWRGIEVPLTARDAKFTQIKARHKFTFRDGELIEDLGTENFVFTYTIPFREDIARAPYKNLFITTLPDFIEACLDRNPGPLVDPVLGEFRAVCIDFSEATDVNKRDGSDVNVTFMHSPEPEEVTIVSDTNSSSAGEDATALDAQIAAVDWMQVESPEGVSDLFSSINGLLKQVQFAGDRISAQLDNAAFKLEQIEESVDELSDPNVWPMKRSSRRLRNATEDLKATAFQAPGRVVKKANNAHNATVSALAAKFGIDVQTFLELNPELARSPFVPQGTPFRFFADVSTAKPPLPGGGQIPPPPGGPSFSGGPGSGDDGL